ncbi:MAG: GGDEF domain-containing protein [Rubrivivax sp.]|nr:GGDEF domain-containing protein [Rubrivivax sp.]
MDAPTVVALLALHILVSAGLLHMVGRAMADGGGLRDFAAGAAIFGAAYVARLALGLTSSHAVVVLLDTMMVGAVLMFASGMRGFFGRGAWTRATVLRVALAFGAVQALVLWQGGAAARHIVLNVALGLGYLTLAWNAARPWWRPLPGAAHASAAGPQGSPQGCERTPALILAGLVCLLGLATLTRAGHIAAFGVGMLYSGAMSQAYFGYSSLVTMTMCPLVLWLVFRRLTHQLADLATRDALTSVLNRNGLEDALRRHFGQRDGATLAWLVVDVDHFKRINDRHGHGTGDKVLRAVARSLMQHARAGDFVARTGGEEFVIGCTSAEPGAAAGLGERLRAAVQALLVPAATQAEPLQCTVSIGHSAPFAALADWETALREADAALYRAKAGGRNRVEGPASGQGDGQGCATAAMRSKAAGSPVAAQWG